MAHNLSLSRKIKAFFDPSHCSKCPFRPIVVGRTAKVQPKSNASAALLAAVDFARKHVFACQPQGPTLAVLWPFLGVGNVEALWQNPYLDARREWDERYADLVLGKRNWQITAAGLLTATLILAGGIV
jgi:hypothetical protein